MDMFFGIAISFPGDVIALYIDDGKSRNVL